MTSKSKTELPPNPEIEGLRIVDLIITEIEEAHMNKTCGKGEYYCYESKKCKKVPKGSHMNSKGRLVPDNDDGDDQEDGGDQAIDPGGMGENVVLHTADGKKFAEIIDLIRPEDVMPKMKAADQWVNEEDTYAQAKKELKATKSARDHRHNTIHKSTNTKGNVDVNENLDDKRRANVQKQKQQSAQTVASSQKSQDSARQVFAKRAQAVAKAKQKAKERASLSKEIDRKVAAATQSEEAVSKKQQRFMGAVLNAKRTGNASTPEVAKAACGMKTKDVKDFASTKHKGLPEKKTKKEELQMTVDEAVRLPSEFGNIVMVGVNWRGKMYNLKMFFPQAKMPTRSDVQDEIVKVYPGGRVQWFDKYELASQEAQWDNDSNPIIKVTKESKDCGCDTHESHAKCDDDCDCDPVTEEVEQIDELSGGTLGSYHNKSRFDSDWGKASKDPKKASKRRQGQFLAREKIAKKMEKMHGKGSVQDYPGMKFVKKEEVEVKEAKAKYDNTKSPDYAKKKAALAKKHGGYDKIKGHPQYEEKKSLAGFMDEGRIADAMRANLEKLKASDEKSQKNLEKFLKATKKVRDDEKKAQDSA